MTKATSNTTSPRSSRVSELTTQERHSEKSLAQWVPPVFHAVSHLLPTLDVNQKIDLACRIDRSVGATIGDFCLINISDRRVSVLPLGDRPPLDNESAEALAQILAVIDATTTATSRKGHAPIKE
jgi:hypothetical protein